MCEKCGVLEVGPLLKENLSVAEDFLDEVIAERTKRNPEFGSLLAAAEEKPRGHYTGCCSKCGSTDLWDDETAYGCHSCGSVYHTG